MVFLDNFPDISIPYAIIYESNTSHIILIQNKQIKLDETHLDRQGNFTTHLSNVMDVLGRLTSILHETRHTIYTCYINSFKDLKTHESHLSI